MSDNVKVTQEFVNKLLESNVWKTAKVLEPQKLNEDKVVAKAAAKEEVATIPCPLCDSALTEEIGDDAILSFTDSVVGMLNENYSVLDFNDLKALNESELESCFCPICNSELNEELSDEAILSLAESVIGLLEQGDEGEEEEAEEGGEEETEEGGEEEESEDASDGEEEDSKESKEYDKKEEKKPKFWGADKD